MKYRMKSLLLFLALVFLSSQGQEFTPLCGDCWCSYGNSECPDFSPGITDSVDEEVVEIYRTFQLTSNPPQLRSASGSTDCYPFADSLGPQPDRYPESAYPQCVFPQGSADSVCAFKYAPNAVCLEREYELITYDSAQAAMDDGAYITHAGPCGVCSTAQDLWVRLDRLDIFQSNALVCAVGYQVDQDRDFSELLSCYMGYGLTHECAKLWSHYSATNGAQCASQCFPDGQGNVELVLDPPFCNYAACLDCSNQRFQADFDALSGRTMPKSGILEEVSRPCDSFSRVENHVDPCVDAAPGPSRVPEGYDPSPAPSEATSPDSSRTTMALSILIIAGFTLF